MRFFFFWVGAAAIGVVSACVSDTPPTQGELNGPCFSDNTCKTGLTCSLVNGAGTCVMPGDASSPVDGGSGMDTSTPVDSGPPVCTLGSTTFPCGGQNPPFACYGAAQSCTATGCSGQTDLQWQCFSPNQCNNACCVASASGTLTPGAMCAQGTLEMVAPDAGNSIGATCAAATTCAPGQTQLCQGNTQCSTGHICAPVAVKGGGLSLNGVVVGACVPE
jgi:hypothetical protein